MRRTGTVTAISVFTPLSRHGIGPVTAGMTLRAAQDVARITVTPRQGGGCTAVSLDGGESTIVLVVEPPAAAGADPMDGVVRAVTGSVLPTDEGAMIGQSREELVAALGQPTETVDRSSEFGPGADLLVFEAGGYAYGALVLDGMVIGLHSGDPGWVDDADDCVV